MRRSPFRITIVLFTLVAAAGLMTACQPLPTRSPTAMGLPQSVATTAPAAPSPTVATEATAEPTSSATRRIRPTPTPAFIGEEDYSCWGSCKTALDAPKPVPVGKPQPASHAGRETCLACHQDLSQPALPDTHQGRLDPACAPCHEPTAARPAAAPTP